MRLSFALPPAGDTATLDKFLVLTMLLVDLLGSYKPSPGEWLGWLAGGGLAGWLAGWPGGRVTAVARCSVALLAGLVHSTYRGLTVPAPRPFAPPSLPLPPALALQSAAEQLKRAAEARQKREAVARAGEADERQRRVEERRQQKAQEEAVSERGWGGCGVLWCGAMRWRRCMSLPLPPACWIWMVDCSSSVGGCAAKATAKPQSGA